MHESPGGAAALLRSNPGLGLLLAARGVSFLGDGIALVALLVYVQQASGTATAVAALLLVADLVPALVAPLAGAAADQYRPRTTLIVCEVTQALLAVLLALLLARLPNLGLMLGVVALVAAFAAAAKPAARLALVDAVPIRDLAPANALFGAATHGLEAAAPLVAAAMLTVWGVSGILMADAATFVAAALMLTRLPNPARSPAAQADRPEAVSLSAGVRFVWSTPAVRAVALGFFALVACTGVDDVGLVVLARDNLSAAAPAAAALYAASGIGLATGYLALTRFGHSYPPLRMLVGGFAVASIGNLLTGVAPGLGLVFACQAVRGVGVAVLDVALNTFVQRDTPAYLHGRLLSALYGLAGLGAALAYLVGGPLVDAVGAPQAFGYAGTAGLLTTAFTAFALHRAGGLRPPPAAPPAP